MERILEDSGSAISPSAAPSPSRSPISFALTTQIDPAQRDRKTAVPQDRFHNRIVRTFKPTNRVQDGRNSSDTRLVEMASGGLKRPNRPRRGTKNYT